jgi:hypothetical protein
MSRTKRGGKAPGYEFWSRRPHSGRGYGRVYKDLTHSTERAVAKQLTFKEVNNLQ